MLNRTEIIGRLTHEPEIGYTQQGTAYCQLRIATNRRVNGEQVPDFHTVAAWNALAEQCGNLAKGEVVYVEGRLETSSWERLGQKRQQLRIVASRVVFLGRGHQINSSSPPIEVIPTESAPEDSQATAPPKRTRRTSRTAEREGLAS